MKPFSSRATTSPSHSVHGRAPRKKKRNENGRRSPLLSVTASSWPFAPCSSTISGQSLKAAPYRCRARPEVVGHRLAEFCPAVQQLHERAAAGEPDRSLACRVAAADDAHARCAAEPRLRRPGRVEDADAFVLGQSLEGKTPVLRAGRQ